MHVLQIGKFYPPYKGGMETHLQMLCTELKQHVKLKVIVANTKLTTEHEDMQGVSVTRAGRLCQPAGAPICLSMAREIRSSPADIVHIHVPNPTAILAYLASGHRGRLVITYHSDTLRQKVLTRLFDPILEQAMHRAAAIIATSPNLIDHSVVLSRWRDRCRVIPFGVDSEQFDRINSTEVARIQEKFGPRIVLAVGRLVYYKGFEYLVQAMPSVKANLIIIGKGPLKKRLLALARDSGVPGRVHILEHVEDAVPFFQAANVFALPSVARTEAFGIVQLEAMAAGKPVVNTDLESGVPYVSLHNITGITVPPKDPKSLAAALNEIINNPKRAAALGSAARSRARQEFAVAKMITRTLLAYDEVTQNGVQSKHAVANIVLDQSA